MYDGRLLDIYSAIVSAINKLSFAFSSAHFCLPLAVSLNKEYDTSYREKDKAAFLEIQLYSLSNWSFH